MLVDFCNSLLITLTVVNVIVGRTSYCIDIDELKTVNVSKVSKLEHGTERVIIENNNNEKRTYQLEDFFWTGSGDGQSDEKTETRWQTQTISTEYKTKTILSTIYIKASSTSVNETSTTNCPFNCEPISVTSTSEIEPTPTFQIPFANTSEETVLNADRNYWLLTVLKSAGKDVVITDIKNGLAKLYKIAFQRQQERHLGINRRPKRNVENPDKPVNVYIHNVSKLPVDREEAIEVLYHVSVSGQPVAAATAAADMNLVSDEEVTKELGHPFIIKAEPYLKANDPQYLSSSNNTWVFIGVALTILFVLLLLVALLTLALSKQGKSSVSLLGKKQDMGHANNAFLSCGSEKENQDATKRRGSSTYINFRSQPSNTTLKSGKLQPRLVNSSSSSSYSSSSIDTSPLAIPKKRKQTPPKKTTISRPKAALNKTVPLQKERKQSLTLESDSSSSMGKSKKSSPETVLLKNYDPGIVSPKSYLSMPSVKSFPRGNIPEPLNKVLEPVSVLHLDLADDEDPDYIKEHHKRMNSPLTRHGSLSAIEDPGVISPVVWNTYCKKLQNEDRQDGVKPTSNSKMRKRFHDLLDETFSLFGSRRESPVDDESCPAPLEVKSHSAMTNRPLEENQLTGRPRPKTSLIRRPAQSETEPPRGAWATNTPSPLSRPLSAGPFRRRDLTPEIDVNRVLAEGALHPNDPAVPLIAAIKTELKKCSLPGSTTNLVE